MEYNQLAFPTPLTDITEDGRALIEYSNGTGMTLLDYFAAKALNGLLAKYNLSKPEDQLTIAKMSYQLADEMLKERKNYIQ